MKIVDIYGWGLPKQADFLNHFKNNDTLYNQARALWSKLDSCTVWFIVAFVVIALVFAIIYYGPYNNKPRRHYKVKHWLIWMLITDRLAVKGKRMRRSTLFYTLFLLACFVLLLTHFMRKYSPETHPLPVLNSRLLPIHVSTIMMAYVLFVILALQSLVALIAHWIAAKGREVRQLSLLSRGTHFNLKLALTLLATGIMLGAIWANQSWGRYWGWDPKEVWALITLMVYAVPLHAFQREYINIGNPKGQRTKVNVECQMVNGKWLNGKWSNSKWYYLYLLLAPLSVAITYFGVNFFLGGMHSYA